MVAVPVDLRRRRILLTATTALGAVGLGVSAVPFVLSMNPSARAKAQGGPIEIDLSKLEPGQMLTVQWRGKPIWVLRRSNEILSRLKTNGHFLVDPDSEVETQQPAYAKNIGRSIKPEFFIAIGLCTHLGCVPSKKIASGALSGLGEDWPGGYFCACHGSKFDLAGRVYKNVPAPTNLVIPPHRYLADRIVEVGVHHVV